jgi:hypothetical protein
MGVEGADGTLVCENFNGGEIAGEVWGRTPDVRPVMSGPDSDQFVVFKSLHCHVQLCANVGDVLEGIVSNVFHKNGRAFGAKGKKGSGQSGRRRSADCGQLSPQLTFAQGAHMGCSRQ